MATTTATISLTSPDLTGDVLSLSHTSTLTKAGFSTGLDQTTGVGRKTTTSTTQYTLVESSDYTNDKGHKIYLRNVSTNVTEYLTVHIGNQEVGRLYGSDFLFMPYYAGADVKITPSVATSMTIEHFLIHE